MFNKTPWNKGSTCSEEQKTKISRKNKGKKGKPRTEDHKRLISSLMKDKPKTEDHKKKLSEALKGKALSEETKNKMSLIRKGKKQEIIECPHCLKRGGKCAMKQWHFDKCKDKK